jgi:hypothetical protein
MSNPFDYIANHQRGVHIIPMRVYIDVPPVLHIHGQSPFLIVCTKSLLPAKYREKEIPPDIQLLTNGRNLISLTMGHPHGQQRLTAVGYS